MKRISLALLLIAVTVFVVPLPAATERNNEETYRQLDLFGTVFERVRTSYVEETTDKQLIEAAINGMLQSLDPHSNYLSPEDRREMEVRTRGEFGGLGIEVTLENGVVKVVSPIDETPAARAGVQSGDLITHVDGQPIVGMSLREAVRLMRGPVGSEVKLMIRRGEEAPFEVSITRAVIRIQSVRSRIEGDNTVGYIRITRFSEQTAEGVRAALESFKADMGDNWQGTVLDLRNNPGGLLGQSVAVADAFLEQGEIVSTRGREEQINSRHNATPGDLSDGRPIVVLINGGSASASEIVAGALKDHRRAIVMGTQSFGKGSVQIVIPLQNRGAIKLTTARYYTPSGTSIQGTGVMPDILVPQARLEVIEQSVRIRERDLRGALDVTKQDDSEEPESGPERTSPQNEDGTESRDDEPEAAPGQQQNEGEEEQSAQQTPQNPAEDYQLARAIDLLRGINLVHSRQSSE